MRISRNISLSVDTNCFLMFFFLQSNKIQIRSLLTSNLVANYHSTIQTTQNLSLLCTSIPPKRPSLIGRTTNGFYFSLVDQFKVLGN